MPYRKLIPFLELGFTAYNYFQDKGTDQAAVDLAETARLADTPENAGYATESDKIMAEEDIAFAETKDYDEYSDTPTGFKYLHRCSYSIFL